jgi:hypothetical protein
MKDFILNFEAVEFNSSVDEEMFFTWIGKIPCIKSVKGEGKNLYATVNLEKLTQGCLREIIGLCERYQIDMGQLSMLKNSNNSSWFSNPNAYWYDKIFAR